jgi:predicted ATPase
MKKLPIADAEWGYRMIESAEIRNFRCFEEAALPDCRRINVVVGKNASGKTALLEALFLAGGPSPEIASRFRTWRGYDAVLQGSFEAIEEAMWGSLFYGFDKQQDIEISLHGTDRHERSLTLSYGVSETILPTTEPNVSVNFSKPPLPPGRSALEWKWHRSDGITVTVRPQFTGSGYLFQGTETDPIPATFFASSHPFYNQENVARFSDLSKRRKAGPLVAAMSKAFPFIKNLDIQAHAGVPMVHADIPALSEKVPLTGVSSGVNKFSTLLLAIMAQPKGVVFIDEVENGIHYSLFEIFWKTLYDFARDNEVQIFATTHSSECLESLSKACHRYAGDISIVRTELEEGASRVEQFYGSGVLSGIKYGEVR